MSGKLRTDWKKRLQLAMNGKVMVIDLEEAGHVDLQNTPVHITDSRRFIPKNIVQSLFYVKLIFKL